MANVRLTKEEEKQNDIIGANIAYYREERGMTQEDLADITSIYPRTISAIENGRLTNIIYIQRIATALGVTIDELINRD